MKCEPAVHDLGAVKHFEHLWEKAWNDHDGEAVAALCAENLALDEPALGGTVHGRDAIRGWVEAMAAGFPDYVFHLQGLYADVAIRAVLVAWRFTGTQAGTGTRVEFHGDDRLEFDEDGLITEYRCLYDNNFVMRQLRKKSQ